MTTYQRSTLFTALFISTVLVAINIVAVSTGFADSYYAGIKEWVETWLILPELYQQ